MVGKPVPAAGLHPTVTPNRGHRSETEKQGREYGCSNVDRVRRMREICRQTQTQKNQYKNRLAQNNKAAMIYIDTDRKLFYCRIGKVGSTSFVDFLEQAKSGDDNITGTRQVNIEYLGYVPVAEINSKYKDYTKIVVVRHPLQRVVSAYYQVRDELVLRDSRRNKPMALDDFLRNVTGRLKDANMHWITYHSNCQFCFVDYHYVIQTETMESDILKMAGIFSYNRDQSRSRKPQLKHENIGVGNKSQIFRHDHLLREFQLKYPKYMQRLLRLYRDDMQLFDYGWDSDKMISLCRNSTKSPKCCT